MILVGPRRFTIGVSGDVFNANDFEFDESQIPLSRARAMAKPKPGATHFSVVRRQGSERRPDYHPLAAIEPVQVRGGDTITVPTDRFRGPSSCASRVPTPEYAMVLPYGSTLHDVFSRIKPNSMTNMDAVQLKRRSVIERQKEMLAVSLRKLEEAALSAPPLSRRPTCAPRRRTCWSASSSGRIATSRRARSCGTARTSVPRHRGR